MNIFTWLAIGWFGWLIYFVVYPESNNTFPIEYYNAVCLCLIMAKLSKMEKK